LALICARSQGSESGGRIVSADVRDYIQRLIRRGLPAAASSGRSGSGQTRAGAD
jgi:hypothetical protein